MKTIYKYKLSISTKPKKYPEVEVKCTTHDSNMYAIPIDQFSSRVLLISDFRYED